MFKRLKNLFRPRVIEVDCRKPELNQAVLADLKTLPYRDGFKYILQLLRYEKSLAKDLLAREDSNLLRAQIQVYSKLEFELRKLTNMESLKPHPAEDEEMKLFKKVSAATTLVGS